MEINADGLVFVDISYSDDSCESLNIAAITRLRQMSKEWCKKAERPYPALMISIVGVEQDLVIGNLSMEKFKERINKAIKDHYDRIIEKEILG